MQPEWIIGILFVLSITLIAILRARREIHSRLPPERYAELNSYPTDENAILHQLHMGNKIKAIKMYREQTGVGLKEAKNAVETMEQRKIFEMTEMYKGDEAIEYMLIAGNKINAIKLYRQRTGVGLKEAKDAVDWLEAQMKQDR